MPKSGRKKKSDSRPSRKRQSSKRRSSFRHRGDSRYRGRLDHPRYRATVSSRTALPSNTIHVFLTNHLDWRLQEILNTCLPNFNYRNCVVESVPSGAEVKTYFRRIVGSYPLNIGLKDILAGTEHLERLTELTSTFDGRTELLGIILNDTSLSGKIGEKLDYVQQLYTILLKLKFINNFNGTLKGGEPLDYAPGSGYDRSERNKSIFNALTTSSGSVFIDVGKHHGIELIPMLREHCLQTPETTCRVYEISSKPLPPGPFSKWKEQNDMTDTINFFFKSVILSHEETTSQQFFQGILNPLPHLFRVEHWKQFS